MTPLIITPKTKIYDLLETYPQLEEVLIAKAPEFKRLKNPLLRNTIARVTTIAQAATIGGLAIDVLVNVLRAKVGQDKADVPADMCTTEHTGLSGNHHATPVSGATEETGSSYTTVQPTWFNPGDIRETFDAGIILNRGEHPVHEVLSRLRKLADDELLEVIAPFIPAPLIDKASGLGYNHWLKQETSGNWHIYFKRVLPNSGEEAPTEDAQ